MSNFYTENRKFYCRWFDLEEVDGIIDVPRYSVKDQKDFKQDIDY